METYEGKHALITGGTTGIGLAIAKLLLSKGARVVVTGRRASVYNAQTVLGDHALATASDAASLDDIDKLAETARAHLGAIHALFINVGIMKYAAIAEVTEKMFDEMFATNVKGAFFALKTLSPLVADHGAIVMTTSVANVKGLPRSSIYAATKGALRSFARSAAGELAPRGIRVNAVGPGPIDTEILDVALGAEAAKRTKDEMRERNPLKRFGRPEEVAAAAAFLAFDATFTTGAELSIDGGVSQI